MPPKSACGHCGLPSCVQCKQRMQQSNYRKKKKSESEVKNKNENFQCFSQMALASRLYFERTSAMLQCLADEKGPEEIKRLDALCQRDPRTKKEGYEALHVQFERTLVEGCEFHGIAHGIPQACTPGQTVGHSPHVALVPALPGFEVGPESRHERTYRRQLGMELVCKVLGWNSKLAKLVLAYRGLAPPHGADPGRQQ